jgi:hypothetical protein
MRVLFSAMSVCLLLLAVVGPTSVADAQSEVAPAPPAATPRPPAAPTGTNADNDAAAKHAKRTACLKEARAKKLVGAQKTAYVKDCTAAP